MDKIKLEFITPKEEIIKYGDYEIKLVPFLQTAQQVVLINNYIDDYFSEKDNSLIGESKYNYLEAELNLMNYVLQSVTNVDTSDFNPDLYTDPNFGGVIKKSIINYDDFRKTLESIINGIKEEITLRNSMGQVITSLMDKLNEFVDKAGDITPETIEKARESGMQMIEELKKSSVFGDPEKKKRKTTK